MGLEWREHGPAGATFHGHAASLGWSRSCSGRRSRSQRWPPRLSRFRSPRRPAHFRPEAIPPSRPRRSSTPALALPRASRSGSRRACSSSATASPTCLTARPSTHRRARSARAPRRSWASLFPSTRTWSGPERGQRSRDRPCDERPTVGDTRRSGARPDRDRDCPDRPADREPRPIRPVHQRDELHRQRYAQRQAVQPDADQLLPGIDDVDGDLRQPDRNEHRIARLRPPRAARRFRSPLS